MIFILNPYPTSFYFQDSWLFNKYKILMSARLLLYSKNSISFPSKEVQFQLLLQKCVPSKGNQLHQAYFVVFGRRGLERPLKAWSAQYQYSRRWGRKLHFMNPFPPSFSYIDRLHVCLCPIFVVVYNMESDYKWCWFIASLRQIICKLIENVNGQPLKL